MAHGYLTPSAVGEKDIFRTIGQLLDKFKKDGSKNGAPPEGGSDLAVVEKNGNAKVYKEPRSKVIIALKGGRFLAEDSGINFDFSRRFASGLRIGAFFTLTDISKEEFGEGSFDKGFYFHIPVELFFDRHSKGLAGFGLRPITRDGGAYLIHSHHLWGVTEQAQNANLTRDWDDLYE